MSILELIRKHGIEPKKASSTKGGEYASSCPGCGGKDRFRVWPEQHDGQGAYWCRQCGCGGDAIQFLRDFEGLTFRQACERLGQKLPDSKDLGMRQPKKQADAWVPRDPAEPETSWNKKAQALVIWASEKLIENKTQMEWLAARGIGEETVMRFWLGWLTEDVYRSRESWGMASVTNEETGKERPLWFPKGLVIPWFNAAGDVVKLRIRRPDPIRSGDKKYYFVPGGASVTTLIRPGNTGRIVRREVYVVVESELDALLIAEEAGDFCGAVALGSNSAHPDVQSAKILQSAVVILNALDFDAAGSSQREWWKTHFPQSRRWPAPRAKDPGDAYKAGVDIRQWIIAGLPEGMR